MIISPYSTEIENITFSLQAQTERCIAFTSANAREGVSTITHSVTQRLLLSGYSVLLVDLNSSVPAVEKILPGEDTKDALAPLSLPHLVSPVGEESAFTGVTITNDKANIAQLRKPHILREKLAFWKTQFDYVLVDCPAILRPDNRDLSADHIAMVCDTTIIVTLAQKTTEASLQQAIRKLDHDDIHLLGLVLNDQKNPGLREEFIRQLNKLKNILPKCTFPFIDSLSKAVELTPFFSIDT